MLSFSYKAKSVDGQTLKGQVESPSKELAVEILRRRKLFVISVTLIKPSIFDLISKKLKKAGLDDVVAFTRQMSTMVASGLPLTEALRILRGQANPTMSAVISEVLQDVEGGASLAAALGKHRGVFSPVYVSLVKAGESAGVLDNILNRLATNLEKNKTFSNKVKGAMIYPSIVVGGMVVVGLIMMIFVIPKLLQMYETFNAELPLATKILIASSTWMKDNVILVFGIIVAVAAGFSMWIKTEDGRRRFELFVFKVPIIGKLQKEVIMTEFTRTIGLLVGAGISIIDALKISADSVDNSIYKKTLLSAAAQVEKGLPLAVPIAQSPYFPPILAQMISVGEETGKVDEVLSKLSLYFEAESEQGVSALTAAIEPLIMIVLGIGVGFLVIAVILPIYNLTSTF
ncbi:type II secretion system F family protein [Candidatus Collierbacteria bacterium]|nr:type II secretion system F family protein [Candidatus Collierbacteria bacterium]